MRKGRRTRIHFTTMTATITIARAWYTIAKKFPTSHASSNSTKERSFENLFKIRPIGVTSKKRLMGALRTFFSISLCSYLVACQPRY